MNPKVDAKNETISKIEASFTTMVMSVASAAAMALGLERHPTSGKIEKDLAMASFNIDLLRMLKEKTKNNLTSEEAKFLEMILGDLQIRFIQESTGSDKKADA